MAGLYIHIPFCKVKCLYCDFYSITNQSLQNPFIEAVKKEFHSRLNELHGEPLETVYIGGGTPSQLSIKALNDLFETIDKKVDLKNVKEITLEVNPDDLSKEYLREIIKLPINRLSMGIQSFSEPMLKFLHRRHTADQAIRAFYEAREIGFDNISIDLIFGLPNSDIKQWSQTLDQAIEMNPNHISAYDLIYEEGTPLIKMLYEKKFSAMPEDENLEQFERLIDRLKSSGYEHYELSNFARPGFRSIHNSNYWKGVPYLGLGPSAHSFSGDNRRYNPANLKLWIEGVETEDKAWEEEILTSDMKYNELIITGLRTLEGINFSDIETLIGVSRVQYCMRQAKPFILSGHLEFKENKKGLKLTRKGLFISDSIISDLLFI